MQEIGLFIICLLIFLTISETLPFIRHDANGVSHCLWIYMNHIYERYCSKKREPEIQQSNSNENCSNNDTRKQYVQQRVSIIKSNLQGNFVQGNFLPV